jgi:hypothetical protein
MSGRAAVLWWMLPSLVACATAPAPGAGRSTPIGRDDIARVHASKCGSCHTPPDPETRTRPHIEEAFSRHKKRVRLTSEEWAMMVDYLAVPDGRTARHPAGEASLGHPSTNERLDLPR